MRLYFWQRKAKPRKKSKKYLENKKQARIFVTERISLINAHYGFSIKRIAIKNTKSRWGSCSRLGNLNFCYKILFLPPSLADYVITHELCHLERFDHSLDFWKLVEKTIPNYRLLRKELKKWVL